MQHTPLHKTTFESFLRHIAAQNSAAFSSKQYEALDDGQVHVIFRSTVSRLVCPGIRPPSVTRDKFFLSKNIIIRYFWFSCIGRHL
jgi:hypothetical protein